MPAGNESNLRRWWPATRAILVISSAAVAPATTLKKCANNCGRRRKINRSEPLYLLNSEFSPFFSFSNSRRAGFRDSTSSRNRLQSKEAAMKRVAILFIAAAVPCLSSQASAQSMVPTTAIVTPYAAVPCYDRPSTVNESWARGRADLMRAAGERDLNSSLAARNWEAARTANIDNWAYQIHTRNEIRDEWIARNRAEHRIRDPKRLPASQLTDADVTAAEAAGQRVAGQIVDFQNQNNKLSTAIDNQAANSQADYQDLHGETAASARDAENAKSWRLLRRLMKAPEVQQILGKPARKEAEKGGQLWVYGYLESDATIGITGSLHFVTGKLVRWDEPPWATVPPAAPDNERQRSPLLVKR
jgi:hypothetical protein